MQTVVLIAPEIVSLRSMPNVGLGYIGSCLAQHGYEVRVLDAQFTKCDPLKILRSIPPTLVGISVDSRTVFRALRIARHARALGHLTLFGGLHVSLVRERILEFDYVDYAIHGDGEIATLKLIEALNGKLSLDQVPGLIYRDAYGGIHVNPTDNGMIDLDALPYPDYRLSGVKQMPLYPLVTSRDCPYSCSFCAIGSISNGRFRARSAESCVDEILIAKERFGIRGFVVVDENFSYDMDRVVRFVQLLNKRAVNLPWTVFEGMRADCIDGAILKLLQASDCRWIFFGVESSDNAVLGNVAKGERFDTIAHAAHLARTHGFRVGGFLIIGLPGSSFKSDMRSLTWTASHLDKAQFWMSIPYYNTRLLEWVRQHARLLREPVGDNLVNSLSTMPFYDTEDYPAFEVKRAHTIASLNTGVDFFFEDLDQYGLNDRLWTEGQRARYRRKFIETVVRWNPSWLPQVAPDSSRVEACHSNGIPDVQRPYRQFSDPVTNNVLQSLTPHDPAQDTGAEQNAK